LNELALEDVQEREAREPADEAPAPPTAPEDNDGGPPFRLRDLRGRDLALALATLGLVIVPFVVALVRAWHDGWVPSGDEANIATRSLDVFSRHPPLTGLPSTSFLYGQHLYTDHPGPFEFYLLAVPLRLFGTRAGPLLTAAAINMSAVLIALWVVYRRAGVNVMLWSSVLLQAVMWSAGTAVLVDTLSSNMPLYSVLCTAVLVWALIDGDIRLLPLTAFVASYAAQQHLAATSLVGALIVFALVIMVVQVVLRARRGDKAIVRRFLLWASIALGVALVCWLPVIVDEIIGRPGNLTVIYDFARDNKRPTIGLGNGVKQAIRAVAPPTMLGRTDWTGVEMMSQLSLAAQIWFGAILAFLIGIGAYAWKRRRALSHLVIITLFLYVAGVVNGANVPQSVEMSRINLYRWTWTAAFLTWTALGWGLVLVVAPMLTRLREAPPRVRRLAPAALLVAAALIAFATVTVSGSDDHNRELAAYPFEPGVADTVLRNIDHHKPVVVSIYGNAAIDMGFYVIFRLVQAGVPIEVTKQFLQDYGNHRKYRPNGTTSALVITSSGDSQALLKPPGRVVLNEVFDPEYSQLLDELVASAAGKKLELAPNAEQVITRDFKSQQAITLVHELLFGFAAHPRTALSNGIFLRYLLEGVITSPHLDLAKVRRLLELSANRKAVAGDERVLVTLVPPDQINKTTVPGL
jgi:hypothetical protein